VGERWEEASLRPRKDELDESDEELNRRVLDKLAEIEAKQAIAKAKPE
jgi:hypothetical protein